MVDPREFDRIHTELTVVGNMMGECVNEFINMKISRKTFDERMSTYADRIEATRRDEDRLLAAFGEIIQKIQEKHNFQHFGQAKKEDEKVVLQRIVKGNPIHSSFAKFYFDSKFALNLSESYILDLLIAMIYKDGSRSHEVQENAIFKESEIKLFMADRAPMYETIVKDLEEYPV